MNYQLVKSHWKIRIVLQKLIFPIVLFLQSFKSVKQLTTESVRVWLGTSLYCKLEYSSIFRTNIWFVFVRGQKQVIMMWFIMTYAFFYSNKFPKLKFAALFDLKFFKTEQSQSAKLWENWEFKSKTQLQIHEGLAFWWS